MSSQVYIDKVKEVIVSPLVQEQSALRERLIRYLWHRAQHGHSHLRGRDLEGLLKPIFESVDGFENVETNLRIGTGEDIDIEFENNRRDPFWRDQGVLIRAECKNWSGRKVGPEQYNHFCAKLRRTRGRCKLGFFISYSGFSNVMDRTALSTASEDLLIALIDRVDLEALVKAKDRQKLLRASVKRAIHLHS